jgi:hypothetical protein
MERNKIQKKVLYRQYSGCMHVVKIVELDDEELPKKSILRYQKKLEKFTSE